MLDEHYDCQSSPVGHFQSAWLTPEGFGSFVQQAWDNSDNLVADIANFTNRACQRNRRVFGNIFHKKVIY